MLSTLRFYSDAHWLCRIIVGETPDQNLVPLPAVLPMSQYVFIIIYLWWYVSPLEGPTQWLIDNDLFFACQAYTPRVHFAHTLPRQMNCKKCSIAFCSCGGSFLQLCSSFLQMRYLLAAVVAFCSCGSYSICPCGGSFLQLCSSFLQLCSSFLQLCGSFLQLW